MDSVGSLNRRSSEEIPLLTSDPGSMWGQMMRFFSVLVGPQRPSATPSSGTAAVSSEAA
jgi:hypothetical protein